ncbi:ABC transporter permease [Candidatus Latescibacterota bacterium]
MRNLLKQRITRASLIKLVDEHRAVLLLALLFAVFSAAAPNFMNTYNIMTIFQGATLNTIVAVGFTVIFILGQLDLSIGAVVMLCGMLVIGLQPSAGWPLSIILSVLAGSCVGFINGLLVVKAKINSFIVTLGMMIVVTSIMHIYSGGGSLAVDDFTLVDWLERPVLPFLTPQVILTLVIVLGGSFLLNRTVVGRGFFLVGGNQETAWLAGLNRDRYLIAGFIISSTTAAIGGVTFAIRLSSMTSSAILGTRTLMSVLSAVIIGGTLMSGGKGSIMKSFFAVLMLTTLFNGIGCFGFGFEVQIFVNGLILALVVLYEAYVINRHNLMRGRRPELMHELKREFPRR